jgi:hypothetical protein
VLTQRPRFHGPGWKLFVHAKRTTIGIAYAVYAATTQSEKTALIATTPANASRHSSKEHTAEKSTAFTGVCVRGFMRFRIQDSGNASSREKAKIWREDASSYG